MRRLFRVNLFLVGLCLFLVLPSSSSLSEEPPTWTVKNKIIHLNEKPIFPLGVYYVAHYPRQKARRLSDLEAIARAGFNMIHTPIDGADRRFLDKCAKLGVYVAVEFNQEPAEMIGLFGRHPAIAFYSTFDDVDNLDSSGKANYEPAFVKSETAKIKEAVPHALTYISASVPERFGLYTNRSDLMAFQDYPLPETPLSSTAYTFSIAETVLSPYNQGFIANLQAFTTPGKRMPTGAEARNMTYQALIRGVTGIIYYTYFDSVMDMNKHPTFWSELQKTVGEVKKLEEMLLKGQRTALATGDYGVFAAQWKLGSKVLIIIANTYSDKSAKSSIILPLKTEGPLKNVFSGKSSKMKLVGNLLSGPIEPVDVHLYQLEIQ